MYSFHCELGLGYMTVPEMLETMHKNNLFDMFLVFSYVVHILGVIPATFCSTEQSFSALRRLKLISAAPWSDNVSVTSHLLTLKGHMPTLWSTMTSIVSLISSAINMAKTAISFNLFYELI